MVALAVLRSAPRTDYRTAAQRAGSDTDAREPVLGGLSRRRKETTSAQPQGPAAAAILVVQTGTVRSTLIRNVRIAGFRIAIQSPIKHR